MEQLPYSTLVPGEVAHNDIVPFNLISYEAPNNESIFLVSAIKYHRDMRYY